MDDIDSIVDETLLSLSNAMEELGRDMVEDIKDDLSTPYPPASSPGESPHMRTGNLRDGVTTETIVNGDTVETVVCSDRADGNPLVPIYLELGTRKMSPRPYMSSAVSRWAPRIPARIALHLRNDI